MGCRADGVGLAPEGVHLRWFVPRGLGLPPGGFDVWRVERGAWHALRRELARSADLAGAVEQGTWSGREVRLALGPELTLVARADAALRPSSGGLVVERPGEGPHLLLHFATPVLALELSVEPDGDDPTLRVRSHHHAAIVDERRLGAQLDIERPGITDVLLPAAVRRIRSIRYVTERSLPEPILRGAGTHLAHLVLPANAQDAYDLVDLAGGLRTRWATATTQAALQSRYPPLRVAALVDRARETLGDPGHTVLAEPAPGQTPAPVRVLDHLALAAIDPVVARMLALLWVDRAPEEGIYLVRGEMLDARKTTIDGWCFSADHAGPPRIGGDVVAAQLPGIAYCGAEPMGRAGLTWPRPDPRRLRPDRTVAVDVRRTVRGVSRTLTERRPHLVSARAERGYTDGEVELDTEVTYAVTPIDAFGRTGLAVHADPIRLRDLHAPVPPKAVRAAVVQPGFPWTDPATRDDAAQRTAELHTTLEFGEAQWRASPDATEVRWLWREGPRPAATLAPGDWNELATVELGPPARHAQVLAGAPHAAAWPATVAAVRRVEPAAVAAAGARLDPALPDAADRAALPSAATVELLLDCALLEPGVLAGHDVRLGSRRAAVLASQAGVAAADDPQADGRMTARVAIEDGELAAAVAAGDLIAIAHPAAEGWPAQALRDWLRLGGVPPGAPPPLRLRVPVDAVADGAARAAGGEVAIDVTHRLEPDPAGGHVPKPVDPDDPGAQVRTLVARVAGTRRVDDDELDLLLRLPVDGALLVLLAAATADVAVAVRRHPPYRLPAVTVGLRGTPGTIALDLAPAQRFATLWVTAITVDARGRASQVATAAEARVVAPPPGVTPAPPYPEREGPDAQAGLASPPDATGVSTLALAWAPLPDPAGTGARFEVARGLDASIVAADRARWLRGGSEAHLAALGIVAGAHAEATLGAGWTLGTNGRTFAVALAPGEPTAPAIAAIGSGRVRIEHHFAAGVRALHHRLVRVARRMAADGTATTELLCAPQTPIDAESLGEIDGGAAVRVDAPPDYAALRGDDDALRALADLDAGEQAFGIVTGTPVDARRFVDRLPGRGANTVLYKVRAVFPGEVRSAWSPASVGCRTLELRRPDPPRLDATLRDGASTVHRIELPAARGVVGVRLVREDGDGALHAWRDQLLAGDGAAALAPARVAATRTLIDLRGLSPGAPLSLDSAPRLVGVFAADVARPAPPDAANLLTGELARGIATLSTDVDGRALALRVELDDGSVTWVDRVAGRHELVLADADVAGQVTWMQAIRRVEHPEQTIDLLSDPVRLTGGAGASDGG